MRVVDARTRDFPSLCWFIREWRKLPFLSSCSKPNAVRASSHLENLRDSKYRDISFCSPRAARSIELPLEEPLRGRISQRGRAGAVTMPLGRATVIRCYFTLPPIVFDLLAYYGVLSLFDREDERRRRGVPRSDLWTALPFLDGGLLWLPVIIRPCSMPLV